jgi:hypothetical protein
MFFKNYDVLGFLDLKEIFSKENSMEKVHRTVDQVHGAGASVHSIVNQYRPLNP